MNLDDMTIGQAREIATMFGGMVGIQSKPDHPMIGEYCLVRSHMMGCFAGIVESVSEPTEDGTVNVCLRQSRQLWRWWCKEGVGLASVAASGLADRSEVRVGVMVDWAQINGVGQICQASDAAIASIRDAKATQNG